MTYYVIRLPSWLINSRIVVGLFVYAFFSSEAPRLRRSGYKKEEVN
jgi:hypothetical protein